VPEILTEKTFEFYDSAWEKFFPKTLSEVVELGTFEYANIVLVVVSEDLLARGWGELAKIYGLGFVERPVLGFFWVEIFFYVESFGAAAVGCGLGLGKIIKVSFRVLQGRFWQECSAWGLGSDGVGFGVLDFEFRG
jgi:hypothetical protein